MKLIYEDPKNISNVIVYQPKVYSDNRGFFFESYEKFKLASIGINENFILDSNSYSRKNVLRGIHYLKNSQQAQIVSVTKGKICDVIVDLRKNSKTFKKWFQIELSDKNHYHLYIPRGFGHSFYVLTDKVRINYKTTEYFNKNNEKGIKWNDPDLNIKWPTKKPILSNRDKEFPFLKDILEKDIPNSYNFRKNKYIEPYLIKIPHFPGNKATLSYFEPEIFGKKNMRRIFYVRGNKNVRRGSHAHKLCNQAIICLNGEISIKCFFSNGKEKSFILKNDNQLLFIPKMTWTDIQYLKNNTIVNVICDRPYETHDYINNFEEFLKSSK